MDGLTSKQAWWLGVCAFAMGGAVASVAYGLLFEWAEGLKKAGVGLGDLADWAAVLVNIIVALSVFALSSRTNRLAKDANERESRIHSETQRQRDREGRLLLVAFRLEIKHYIYYLKRCRTFIKEGGPADRFKKHRVYREAFLREVKALRLDTIKSNADRIHLLLDRDAVSFTRLGTSVQILDAMASVLCARADEIKDEHIHKFRKSFDDKLRAAERAGEVCEAALATFDMRVGIEIPAAGAAKDAGRGTAA